MTKIAYLGPAKTFTEKAAQMLFPNENLLPMQPNRAVIRAVETGAVDFGVVPIENFYNGEVRETIDALLECEKTKIIGEWAIPIIHCIGALPGTKTIEEVMSKDQALEQCSRYLSEKYAGARITAVGSTAEAARKIAAEKLLNAAAIGPESALLEHGLEILAKDICPNNRTRFAKLGYVLPEKTGNDKTFIAFHPQYDTSGVLQSALSIFNSLDINLTSIQSRPDGKKGYVFFVEMNGHLHNRNVAQALSTLELSLDPQSKYKDTVKVLGSYADTRWKDEN